MLQSVLAVALLFTAATATAQCTIPALGTDLNQNGVLFDGWTPAYPIGFAFPFGGSTYTGIFLSDHSTVALTNGGTPAAPLGGSFLWNPATTNLSANGPFLAPYWSDHTIGIAAGADIFLENGSGSSCTITWFMHQTYLNLNPAFTVKCTLFADGRIQFRYDGNVSNNGSMFGALNAIIGISAGGGAALPAMSDLSAGAIAATDEIFEEFITTGAGVPNPLFDVSNSVIEFLPTNPGWVVVNAPLPCASKATYGAGCGAAAPLSLDSTLPSLGANWDFTTTNVDPISPIAITFFGTQVVNPGIPLALLGAPGCSGHIDALNSSITGPSVGGTAIAGFGVPATSALVGAQITAQSISLTLGNALGLLTSNGLLGVLGF